MEVPPVMRKAFYMYKVLGYYQKDISSKLSIPQRTVSFRIVREASGVPAPSGRVRFTLPLASSLTLYEKVTLLSLTAVSSGVTDKP